MGVKDGEIVHVMLSVMPIEEDTPEPEYAPSEVITDE